MNPQDVVQNYFVHKQKAELLMEVGRYREALKELEEDLRARPDDHYSLCLATNCHFELGQYQTAYEISKKAVAAAPDSEWGHRLQSLLFAATGDNRKAHDSALKSVELEPNSLFALQTLFFAQIGVWKLDEAEKTVAKILEISPDSEVAQNAAGYLALKKEDYSKAELYYEAVLRINPENSGALNNLGVIYLEYANRGKGNQFRKRSAEMFERSVKLQPTFIDGQENLKIATSSVAKAGIPITAILLLCGGINLVSTLVKNTAGHAPEFFRGLTVLNPYSPNYLIFGLNILLIGYTLIVVAFAVRYFFSKDRAALVAPFSHVSTWIVIAIGTTIPAIFYLVFLVFLDIEANAFAFIGLLIFFGLALYANLQGLLRFNLRQSDSDNG